MSEGLAARDSKGMLSWSPILFRSTKMAVYKLLRLMMVPSNQIKSNIRQIFNACKAPEIGFSWPNLLAMLPSISPRTRSRCNGLRSETHNLHEASRKLGRQPIRERLGQGPLSIKIFPASELAFDPCEP